MDGGGWMQTDATAAATRGAAVDAGQGEDEEDGYSNLMSPLFSAAAAATDKTGGGGRGSSRHSEKADGVTFWMSQTKHVRATDQKSKATHCSSNVR